MSSRENELWFQDFIKSSNRYGSEVVKAFVVAVVTILWQTLLDLQQELAQVCCIALESLQVVSSLAFFGDGPDVSSSTSDRKS